MLQVCLLTFLFCITVKRRSKLSGHACLMNIKCCLKRRGLFNTQKSVSHLPLLAQGWKSYTLESPDQAQTHWVLPTAQRLPRHRLRMAWKQRATRVGQWHIERDFILQDEPDGVGHMNGLRVRIPAALVVLSRNFAIRSLIAGPQLAPKFRFLRKAQNLSWL